MSPPDSDRHAPGFEARRFATTRWTDVLLAREQESPEARQALERLCVIYWYPIYAHIRHHVQNPHDAEDFTQEFFRLLIAKNYLGAVDRQRGKFRSFLLMAVNRFLSNARKHAARIKRGGGQPVLSLDAQAAEGRYLAEPATDQSPDKIFERRWAQTVLDQALAHLRDEHAGAKAQLFDALEKFLTGEARFGDYTAAAKRLHLTPSAIAVAVHRLRQRYRELLRAEVQPTLADPADTDAEMRHLFAVLSG